MRVLVLGGTRFVGRALVERALSDGHDVTLFNRGTTNPELFPDVEKLRGDRLSDLSPLTGRDWDVVIDVAAYEPTAVARSTAKLREAVGRYVFVSSVSVYADHSGAQREDEPVEPPGDTYGAKKAMGEAIVSQAFDDRATIVRAGMIAGPHDTTDRLSYWPKRIAHGGRVLAPGAPDDPIQLIDVRDLADFLLRAPAGTFNATGRSIELGELLEICKRVTHGDAELLWVPSDRLLAVGVDPWMGVPLWIAAPGWEGANRVDIRRALAAGLRLRPVADTVEAAWRETAPPTLVTALPEEREQELLRIICNA